MAPPTPQTSSGARRTRTPAQPTTTARQQPTMDPSRCFAPRIPLKPLPSVTSHNGHINYPTAMPSPPASNNGQRPRGNALGLSGMSPQTAPSRIVPPSPPSTASPFSTHPPPAPVLAGAVQPIYALPTIHPTAVPSNVPLPLEQRQQKRRQSSSPPPTPTPTPPLPAPLYPDARRRQSSQPSYEAAQFGSSPTT